MNKKLSTIKKIRSLAGIAALSSTLAMSPANAGSNDDAYRTAGINIVLAGIVSGVGSKIHGNGFWHGFRHGCLAGNMMYAGKYAMYNWPDKPLVPLAGKALHSLGVSIRDNVALGKKPSAEYSIDLGPVNLRYSRDERDFSYKLLPSSLIGIPYSISRHGKLDLEDTLNTATLVFHTDRDDYIDSFYSGTAPGTTIVLNKQGEERIFGHELIHTAQNRELSIFDRAFSNKLEKKNNWFSRINDRLELARDAVHSFLLDPISENNYDKSWLELEAYRGYRKNKE